MNTTPQSSSFRPVTRRTFLRNGAILTAGLAALSPLARAQVNKNSKLRIFQIGVGGIGSLQRNGLKGHAQIEWAGFCDVDSRELENIKKQHPNAWTVADYREAFANKAADYDAVIVDVPDFHHATAMMHAIKLNKHIYGQKPLVHQLSELKMIRDGLKARPGLKTQMGNQRACNRGRMVSVEILRKNQLGRPVEAFVWTGGVSRGHYFADPWSAYTAAKPVPEHLNWDLWRGPLGELPYSEDLAPRRWRAFWETGGGQLADWGCHLLDLLYFAYDLPSPEAVITHTPKASNTGHSAHNMSTITYAGGGGKFAREKFVVHYNDDALLPSFAALGLPPVKPGANHTMVVCEEGTLLLQADGAITVFRKGKEVEDEPMPQVAPRNHWKDWADNCLGDNKPLWTPFEIGWRITEPALLATKATRFPGQELRWDAANFKFSNSEKANQQIVSRKYREGWEPPVVA